uniref:Kinesin-like protein n=1 Tax=Parastrongyloides trichosuri TaxID=131310 RepID=A0A0N4ZYT3_PARTI
MSSLFAASSINYGKGGKSCMKVGIRIRPRNPKEISEQDVNVLRITKSSITVCGTEGDRKFEGYDFVLDDKSTQCGVYKKMVAEYIPRLLEGFNCTIFAYGQTGTGKTFTMGGVCNDLEHDGSFKWDSDNSAGVTSRAMQHIFQMLSIPSCARKEISVSYVELYNEDIYDLLGEDTSKKLQIFDDPENSGATIIKGVKEYIVESVQDIYHLLDVGAANRQTSSTAMNQRSSRSHAVFIANVEWDEIVGDDLVTRKGKINLVDLAGSENIGKSGTTKGGAREAGKINTSLLSLGQVINALTEKSGHIPYRSSKLTRILKDSLGGSALTCLIATISPTSSNKGETLSTLEYGLKAMNVENDIRANIKARQGPTSSSIGVMMEYVKLVSLLSQNKLEIVMKNNLLKNVDKDLFSKVDLLVNRRDEILDEARKWLQNYSHTMETYKSDYEDKKLEMENNEMEFLKREYEAELLKYEVEDRLKELQDLKESCETTVKTVRNRLNTEMEALKDKYDKLKNAKELVKERREFFEIQNTNMKNIGTILNDKMSAFDETLVDVMESSKNDLVCKGEQLIEESVTTLRNASDKAETAFKNLVNEREVMSNVIKEQDKCVQHLHEHKNKFEKLSDEKIARLEIIASCQKALIGKCKGNIEQLENVKQKVGRLDELNGKMKKLCIETVMSETEKDLKAYLEEVELMNL